jgi:hypothetical protein
MAHLDVDELIRLWGPVRGPRPREAPTLAAAVDEALSGLPRGVAAGLAAADAAAELKALTKRQLAKVGITGETATHLTRYGGAFRSQVRMFQ